MDKQRAVHIAIYCVEPWIEISNVRGMVCACQIKRQSIHFESYLSGFARDGENWRLSDGGLPGYITAMSGAEGTIIELLSLEVAKVLLLPETIVEGDFGTELNDAWLAGGMLPDLEPDLSWQVGEDGEGS